MKFIKKLFWFALFTVIGIFALKLAQRIRMSIRLGKTLPLFLKNTVGEEPLVNLTMALRDFHVRLGFDPETIEREQNLEKTVLEYIDDFYPVFAGMKVRVTIVPRDAFQDHGCCCNPQSSRISMGD